MDLIKDITVPGSSGEESSDPIGSDYRSRAMAIAPDICDPKTHFILGGSKRNAFVLTLVADITLSVQLYPDLESVCRIPT